MTSLPVTLSTRLLTSSTPPLLTSHPTLSLRRPELEPVLIILYHINCETMKRNIARLLARAIIRWATRMPVVNKKVPDLMKDENNSVTMIRFVGLSAKMYARVDGKKDTKRAEGIKSNVITR